MIDHLSDSSLLRRVEEVASPGAPDLWVHPEWEERFPWLVKGTTGSRASELPLGTLDGAGPFMASLDFALFRDDEPAEGLLQWRRLARTLGFPSMVGARQVHGREIHVHATSDPERDSPSPGRAEGHGPIPMIGSDADGHATGVPGILMGVTVADCVPVFMVDPERRVLCLLHAGWKGVALGILEAGIQLLGTEFQSEPRDLVVHLGPAICGACYEVGPEVHAALSQPLPNRPSPVDLRAVLARRALARGVEVRGITMSSFCAFCGGSPFFSHRGGDRERQVGYLGIRPMD
jgi:YfiH family protein